VNEASDYRVAVCLSTEFDTASPSSAELELLAASLPELVSAMLAECEQEE